MIEEVGFANDAVNVSFRCMATNHSAWRRRDGRRRGREGIMNGRRSEIVRGNQRWNPCRSLGICKSTTSEMLASWCHRMA